MNGLIRRVGKLKKLTRFYSLSGPEKLFFVRAWVLLQFVEFRVRRHGFKPYVVMHVADRIAVEDSNSAGIDLEIIQKKAELIAAAARLCPLKARCLARSIYLHQLLLRERILSTVVIGMDSKNSDFTAHAWLEVGGEVVNDSEEAVSGFIRVDLDEARFNTDFQNLASADTSQLKN